MPNAAIPSLPATGNEGDLQNPSSGSGGSAYNTRMLPPTRAVSAPPATAREIVPFPYSPRTPRPGNDVSSQQALLCKDSPSVALSRLDSAELACMTHWNESPDTPMPLALMRAACAVVASSVSSKSSPTSRLVERQFVVQTVEEMDEEAQPEQRAAVDRSIAAYEDVVYAMAAPMPLTLLGGALFDAASGREPNCALRPVDTLSARCERGARAAVAAIASSLSPRWHHTAAYFAAAGLAPLDVSSSAASLSAGTSSYGSVLQEPSPPVARPRTLRHTLANMQMQMLQDASLSIIHCDTRAPAMVAVAAAELAPETQEQPASSHGRRSDSAAC